MEGNLTLSIYSPERKLVEKVAVQVVTLTGSEGQIQVLPGHANMVGTIEPGFFSYTSQEGAQTAGFISTGFFEVNQGHVSVAAEVLELAGEIDIARAKAAQQKAEKMLGDNSLELENFGKYQLKLQRSLIRQQIAGKTH